MSTVPESVLRDVAAKVAGRVAGRSAGVRPLPERYALVILSDNGVAGDAFDRIVAAGLPAVVVVDRPSPWAVAAAMAALSSVEVAGEDHPSVDDLVSGAALVYAPSLGLAIASRVAALQADTPASRAIVKALVSGVPVEATLDPSDFDVSDRAPEGARRAVASVEARLRELGVVLGVGSRRDAGAAASGERTTHPLTPAGAYGAGRPHPSQERFTLPDSVNEFVEFLEKKGCSIEPGKACVDCGACETRGF